jgi:serine/threonine protein kinase
VLQLLGSCSKPPRLAMVTEYLPHSLHSVLYGSAGGGAAALDRARILALAQDIARAFVYLHSRKPPVIHRDIKPANFLLDRAWRVKVQGRGPGASSVTWQIQAAKGCRNMA